MQPIMKKLFVLMCVALLSMSAQAQEKGDFAIGLRVTAGSGYFVTVTNYPDPAVILTCTE